MIDIPLGRLPPELLAAIIEEYICREGTDYGANEVSLETKIQQLKKQISRGDIVITFDQETETCNLLTKEMFQNISHKK
ncbi:MAG: YheU family protein [Porticoccus sp.]|nr:YheU family protein [Porticoccus sp.]